MIKAVIFDLDDTLYNEAQFVKSGFKSVASYIAQYKGFSRSKIYKLLLRALKKHGRGHTFDIVLKENSLCKNISIKKLVGIYRAHKPKLSLYSGTKSVLNRLKKQNYKLGLITDGNLNTQRNKVNALKIRKFFDSVIFTNRYGINKQKPNSFPYRMALAKLNVKPYESVYVGDNPHKDFITAKRLGMYTVRVIRGQYKNLNISKQYEAVHKVKDLNSIFIILKFINKNYEKFYSN